MKLVTLVWMLCIGHSIHAQNLDIMETNTNNRKEIEAVINHYFKGIETGDTTLLGQTFHPDALLFGDINGTPYAKTRNEYLSGVANRVSPEKSGPPFEAEILSIDVINSIATAKLHVKMYTFNYYNFLTLHETNGKWLIVNKTLTNLID